MKIVAFNGSPRKNGNTAALLRSVLNVLEEANNQVELVQVGGQLLRGCVACFTCYKKRNRQCEITTDALNSYIDKIVEADAVILGSPTYFADVSTEMKALIDRAGMVAKANDDLFKRKVGAAVVAVRRAGSIHAFDTMNHFFTISQMIVVGSSYWNMAFGLQPGDALNDEEGSRTMYNLGQNMAWLLEKIHA